MKIQINVMGNMCDCDKPKYETTLFVDSYALPDSFSGPVFCIKCSKCKNEARIPMKNVPVNFTNEIKNGNSKTKT